MTSLFTKTKLYIEANSKTWDDTKVTIQDDMIDGVSSPYIKTFTYNGLSKPTAEQLNSYETAGNTAEALQTVLNNRANNYPSIVDQLDDIYHNGIDAWKATIKTTKDKYPK